MGPSTNESNKIPEQANQHLDTQGYEDTTAGQIEATMDGDPESAQKKKKKKKKKKVMDTDEFIRQALEVEE